MMKQTDEVQSLKKKIKELEAQLALRNDSIEGFSNELNNQFFELRLELLGRSNQFNLEELLTFALDEVCKILNSPIGFYHFISEDQKTIELQAWSTKTLNNYCKANKDDRHYDINKAGIWVESVYKKKPVIHNDYQKVDNKKGLPEGHAELIRELVVPVIRNERVVAIFGVGNKTENYTIADTEILSFLADVTWVSIHQKRIQEALEKSESKYKNFLDQSPSGIMIIGENFQIDYINDTFSKILSYSKEDLTGADFRIVVADDDIALLSERYQKRRRGEDIPEEYEFRAKRSDGTIRQLYIKSIIIKDSDGSIKTIAQVIDKTEAVNTEVALMESELKYRTLVENSPDGICMVGLDGHFISLNKAGLELSGYSSLEDLLSSKKTVFDFVAPWDKEKAKVNTELIVKETIGGPYEYDFLNKDGSAYKVELSASLNKDAKGNPLGFTAIFRDLSQRKETENRLLENERFIRAIADTSPLLISVFDLTYLKYIYFSKAIETVLGYAKNELEDMSERPIIDLLHPEDTKHFLEHYKELSHKKDNDTVEFSYRLKHKNGKYRTIKSYESPFEKNNEGRIIKIISVSLDETEQLIAENLLKSTTKRLSNILLAANDGMWDWDLITNEVLFDRRYFELAGYEENDFPHNLQAFQDRVHPDDLGRLMASAQDHLEGKTDRFQVQFRFLRKDDQWMWILGRGIITERDKDNAPLRLLGTHTDISENKKVEEHALKLSKAIEQSPESIIITNKNGSIEYVNPSFTLLTGYSFEDVVNKNPRILKSGHHDMEFYKDIWNTINKGETWTGEIMNKKKNGILYWERVIIAPLLQEDGTLTHFVSVREDVTQKKQILTDLKIAKEHAEESDRLKSSFLANMSHEIRTPMNGILGFTDLLGNNEITEEQRAEYIKIIRKSGDRMLSTINDIIDISKIEADQTEVIFSKANVCDHLQYMHKFFLPEVEDKGLSLIINLSLSEDEAILYTDHDKLLAILSNLIKNAIKYSEKGTIVIGCELKGQNLEFYVEDQGIGIAPERHKAIFERFVQADLTITKPYEGSGLGLAISKAFAELIGGKMWLSSEPGKGSRFSFSLPYKTSENEIEEQYPTVNSNLTMDKLLNYTVLIAEDDESAAYYLSELLKKKCKKIIHASTGLQAIDICNDQHIDLVLMDIKMPDIDGFEATKKIRETNPDLPIIGQTAYALLGDRKKVIEAGCNEYISKPINKEELYETISRII